MSTILPTGGVKWIHRKDFDSYEYSSNSSKGCPLKVELEHPNYVNCIMVVL